MADAASLPILVDDTGHGNFNNARRVVRKLEERGVAGVCIEDKVFPKTNTFIDGEGQTLADCDEFCGKLKAAKDTVHDDRFVIVARTEALIVGRGLTEALSRAHAYWRAGADAILVHSARSDALLQQGAPAALDHEALSVFLHLGFFLGDDTPFAAVKAVPANAVLEWEHGRLTITGARPRTVRQPVRRDQALDGFAPCGRRTL